MESGEDVRIRVNDDGDFSRIERRRKLIPFHKPRRDPFDGVLTLVYGFGKRYGAAHGQGLFQFTALAVREGDAVTLTFAPDAAHLFDRASGTRLN